VALSGLVSRPRAPGRVQSGDMDAGVECVDATRRSQIAFLRSWVLISTSRASRMSSASRSQYSQLPSAAFRRARTLSFPARHVPRGRMIATACPWQVTTYSAPSSRTRGTASERHTHLLQPRTIVIGCCVLAHSTRIPKARPKAPRWLRLCAGLSCPSALADHSAVSKRRPD
jgi:hypothetical protein